MSETRYYLHGILLPSGSLISQLEDHSAGVNNEELVGYSSGHIHPLFRGVNSQSPGVTFTSTAIGQVLDAIIAGGDNYIRDLSAGNTDVEYRQGKSLGFRYATSDAYNERLRLAKAFLSWDTIAADHGRDARISCRLVGLYDLTNAPMVQVGSGTLTGVPAITSFYTLGPVKVNGSWLESDIGWSLASGLTYEEGGSSGLLWPTYGGGQQLNQVLTLTRRGKPWGGLSSLGSAITSLVFYLRAKAADGQGNIADGTAQHIKFTATNGVLLPDTATGAGNNATQNSSRIGIRAASGSVDCLAIDTASVIA